jgi:hypothetical protein
METNFPIAILSSSSSSTPSLAVPTCADSGTFELLRFAGVAAEDEEDAVVCRLMFCDS